MSLAEVSKHISARGRNGDTMLVHMTPREVAGLQALAVANGTTMTINPQTGLPEAFNLRSLLPAALGAAGTLFGIPPTMTAAVLGGLTALRSGDIGRGLMTGLGAYGGGNLANAWGATAGTAGQAAGAAGQAAGEAAGQMALPPVPGTEHLASQAAQSVVRNPNALQLPMRAAPSWFDRAGEFMQGNMRNIGMAAAPMLMESAATAAPTAPAVSSGTYRPYRLEEKYNFEEGAPGSSSERRFVDRVYTPVQRAMGGEIPAYACGGLTALAAGGSTHNGGKITGAGDGVSDDVPAGIMAAGGQIQPALLAEGEYVIPARVVSELGNGSTDAGVKLLDQFVERVNTARAPSARKGKHAIDSNADRYLPA